MKTDDLINALAADAATKPPKAWLRLWLLPALGIVVALAAMLIELGVRGDIAAAAGTWRFLLKLAVAAMLALLALRQAISLYRPQAAPRLAPLLAVLALLGLAVLAELLLLPREAWLPRLVGRNAAVCMVAIPLLSLAPLAALLYALRAGAPRHAAQAGALAGLASAGIAASFYALHCPDDSPLFVLTWYGLSGVIVTGLGALLGHRLLRW
ncbi:NrsF family protein [Ferrovibrio sp. MS7]|uniref:NrsF family protein n=1 Tax=Ferrovibrio plantarum TaxID=3119164 RepID=UPI0031359BD5